MIIDLLKYTTFLRCQPHRSVNFSLLQAVISWIQDALRLTPIHLPDVRRSGELLSRAVASTSGFGLKDIWSSWTGSISPNSYSSKLEHAALGANDSESGHSRSHCRLSTYRLTHFRNSIAAVGTHSYQMSWDWDYPFC